MFHARKNQKKNAKCPKFSTGFEKFRIFSSSTPQKSSAGTKVAEFSCFFQSVIAKKLDGEIQNNFFFSCEIFFEVDRFFFEIFCMVRFLLPSFRNFAKCNCQFAKMLHIAIENRCDIKKFLRYSKFCTEFISGVGFLSSDLFSV